MNLRTERKSCPGHGKTSLTNALFQMILLNQIRDNGEQ